MALDNPSYFTIPGGTNAPVGNRGGRFSLIRKHVRMGSGSSSLPINNNSSPSSSKSKKKGERYSALPTTSTMNVNVSATTLVPESSPSLSSETGFRRSFRSLLQANTFENSLQTQMFVLGMPRPSDIAPTVQQMSHSAKKHARNASTGKAYRLPTSDLFAPSKSRTPDSGQDPSAKDLVLPAEDRYYNASPGVNFLQTGRRHSIGAYFNRKATSIPRNEPQIEEEIRFGEEPSRVDVKFAQSSMTTGTDSESEKQSCTCRWKKGGKVGMEDIIIISSNRSQAADLWVTYLKTCFEQIRKNRNKPPFRILSLEVENFGGSWKTLSLLDGKLKNAKLAVFIICPVFLEHVALHPEQCAKVCKYIRPDGTLAMLLGIRESTVTNVHKTGLTNYSQWKRMESVKDRDEKFVGDFLGAAMDIISKNITQNNQPTEKGSFMLMPKKVNKSQNKVLILLNDPIAKEDSMRVTVIRNNEVFDIPTVKKRNPYTLIFRMPEELLAVSLLVTIRVERNGVDLGAKLLKCESQLYAMAQILKSCDSPLEFMCQALNIVPCDKDKLDECLMSSFQRNVPPNFNLLQTSGLGQLHRGVISKDEFPTLLHFAARFGLEKLCWALLECPGGELACDVRNVNELTPSELAENMGHTKLANALCGYMQMTEFTSVYTFLKGMTDDRNNKSVSDSSDGYLNPRPLSETYQVPPSPRPLTQVYSHPPFGYMQMQSPKSSLSSSISDSHETGRNMSSSKEKLVRKNSEDSLKRIDGDQALFKSLKDTGKGIQDELIEIINDFKNNVFTISEVEKLVEDWRNRNDVQQSFKEKQEQLNKMREEYERVQQKLKEEMKSVGRPSPLERIRKFFRTKFADSTRSNESQQDGDKKCRLSENLPPYRPSSGLSIQSCSSSSSGRLSTGSHCSGTSLGDSGTHSDAESDRKVRWTSTPPCNGSKPKEGLDNYDVPPSPVCLVNGKPKSTNGIANYDIPPSPPSLFVEYGIKPQWESDSSLPCDSHATTSHSNYYNLIGKDIPVPNRSTLHGTLIKAASKNCLKILEESISESKTEEINCYEYINLPNSPLDHDYEGEDGAQEKETSPMDTQVPDYVNVENGLK